MTVRIAPDGSVVLQGICGSEDAEALLQQLLANPVTNVDWRACETAHTAVVQVLMAARPILVGPPLSVQLRNWVQPWFTNRTT
jgi:hypothetical protein